MVVSETAVVLEVLSDDFDFLEVDFPPDTVVSNDETVDVEAAEVVIVSEQIITGLITYV